jgi:ribonucleotide reductase beta subunit family protein with ferritin-like domain
MPFSFVKNIARKVKRIMKDETLHVEFKRVNIPKKQKDEDLMMEYVKKGVKDIKEMKGVEMRPLGVPTHA